MTDQNVRPTMLTSPNFAGNIPIAGTAISANNIVTMSVIIALQ